MIPLRDANPTRRAALVTLAMVLACCVAYGWELGLQARGGDALDGVIRDWGIVPGRLTAAWARGDFLSIDTLTLQSPVNRVSLRYYPYNLRSFHKSSVA